MVYTDLTEPGRVPPRIGTLPLSPVTGATDA